MTVSRTLSVGLLVFVAAGASGSPDLGRQEAAARPVPPAAGTHTAIALGMATARPAQPTSVQPCQHLGGQYLKTTGPGGGALLLLARLTNLGSDACNLPEWPSTVTSFDPQGARIRLPLSRSTQADSVVEPVLGSRAVAPGGSALLVVSYSTKGFPYDGGCPSGRAKVSTLDAAFGRVHARVGVTEPLEVCVSGGVVVVNLRLP